MARRRALPPAPRADCRRAPPQTAGRRRGRGERDRPGPRRVRPRADDGGRPPPRARRPRRDGPRRRPPRSPGAPCGAPTRGRPRGARPRPWRGARRRPQRSRPCPGRAWRPQPRRHLRGQDRVDLRRPLRRLRRARLGAGLVHGRGRVGPVWALPRRLPLRRVVHGPRGLRLDPRRALRDRLPHARRRGGRCRARRVVRGRVAALPVLYRPRARRLRDGPRPPRHRSAGGAGARDRARPSERAGDRHPGRGPEGGRHRRRPARRADRGRRRRGEGDERGRSGRRNGRERAGRQAARARPQGRTRDARRRRARAPRVRGHPQRVRCPRRGRDEARGRDDAGPRGPDGVRGRDRAVAHAAVHGPLREGVRAVGAGARVCAPVRVDRLGRDVRRELLPRDGRARGREPLRARHRHAVGRPLGRGPGRPLGRLGQGRRAARSARRAHVHRVRQDRHAHRGRAPRDRRGPGRRARPRPSWWTPSSPWSA